MPMSRKHYQAVAEAVGKAESEADARQYSSLRTIILVVRELCGVFAEDNPNFDEEKFRAAVTKAWQEEEAKQGYTHGLTVQDCTKQD